MTPCGPWFMLNCFQPERGRFRQYARVYENRVEYNIPCYPCLCCSKERCIVDFVQVRYFDNEPNRAGMCCYCIPCICCGPPVVWNQIPRCCCSVIDCRPCCGETIFMAPCNCFNLRVWYCCGAPCYKYCCAFPILFNIQKGEEFLGKWQSALEKYFDERNMKKNQMAIFRRVADRCCDCDAVRVIEGDPVTPLVMDRGGNTVPEHKILPSDEEEEYVPSAIVLGQVPKAEAINADQTDKIVGKSSTTVRERVQMGPPDNALQPVPLSIPNNQADTYTTKKNPSTSKLK